MSRLGVLWGKQSKGYSRRESPGIISGPETDMSVKGGDLPIAANGEGVALALPYPLIEEFTDPAISVHFPKVP